MLASAANKHPSAFVIPHHFPAHVFEYGLQSAYGNPLACSPGTTTTTSSSPPLGHVRSAPFPCGIPHTPAGLDHAAGAVGPLEILGAEGVIQNLGSYGGIIAYIFHQQKRKNTQASKTQRAAVFASPNWAPPPHLNCEHDISIMA
ncbi:hypothetical protein CKAH01_03804 [Colletotrichum kahawae]|uniref:Uncharacterized protein n=1 Tax=Colletotrichum kahawae TaxID=34407 RepID=A0AAD9YPL6_COLKA|nr:hypothetical protein CKAH01_03804 [Colletotrichum kahawae]